MTTGLKSGGCKGWSGSPKLSLEMLWVKLFEVLCSQELLPLIRAEDWCSFPVSFLGLKWQILTSELLIRLLKCPCIYGWTLSRFYKPKIVYKSEADAGIES